jgi:hypothetical protein
VLNPATKPRTANHTPGLRDAPRRNDDAGLAGTQPCRTMATIPLSHAVHTAPLCPAVPCNLSSQSCAKFMRRAHHPDMNSGRASHTRRTGSWPTAPNQAHPVKCAAPRGTAPMLARHECRRLRQPHHPRRRAPVPTRSCRLSTRGTVPARQVRSCTVRNPGLTRNAQHRKARTWKTATLNAGPRCPKWPE